MAARLNAKSLPKKARPVSATDGPRSSATCSAGARLPRLRPEPLHDPPRFLAAAAGEQELGRFGDERAEQDERQTGRQVEHPQDSPAEGGLQKRREAARREITADRAQAADQHQRPAAVPARHHLGEQRIGDRQHPARRNAHHEAHADVPRERRHRAADRGADEHHGGEQDRRLAPVDVGEHAPDDRADHRSRPARRTGTSETVALVDLIFAHHPGKGEAQARRLHDVDDQRDHEHRHQAPVRQPSGASSGGVTTMSCEAASWLAMSRGSRP